MGEVDEGHDGQEEIEKCVSCIGPAWAQWVVGTSSGREVKQTIVYAVSVRSLIGILTGVL